MGDLEASGVPFLTRIFHELLSQQVIHEIFGLIQIGGFSQTVQHSLFTHGC